MNGSPVYMNLDQGDGVPQFSQRGLGGMFNLGNLGGSFLALDFGNDARRTAGTAHHGARS